MIEEIITEYIKPIIMIMGLIELVKKCLPEKKSKYFWITIQTVLCLIAGILVGLQGWVDGINTALIVLIMTKFLVLLSLTTLFYEFFLKKIREAGGKIKGK